MGEKFGEMGLGDCAGKRGATILGAVWGMGDYRDPATFLILLRAKAENSGEERRICKGEYTDLCGTPLI